MWKIVRITSKMPLEKEELNRTKKVLSEIDAARKAIRYKQKILKLGKEGIEQTANELFKPLVTPLNELTNATKREREREIIPLQPEKEDIRGDIERWALTNAETSGTQKFDKSIESIDLTTHKSNISELSNETVVAASDLHNNSNVANSTLEYPAAISDYLKIISTNEWDKPYGVRKLSKQYKIGNAAISFTENEIMVDKEKYPMSVGLMELLFKRIPDHEVITSDDLHSYKKIILDTNGHCKNYEALGAIRDAKSQKYIKYISLFGSTRKPHAGKGIRLPKYKIARKREYPVDYVYWDDPNELVDRLRLLMATQSAGNTSHSNEILSLIEELREAKIIY